MGKGNQIDGKPMVSRVKLDKQQKFGEAQISEAQALSPELVGRSFAIGGQYRIQGENAGLGLSNTFGLNNIVDLDFSFDTIGENYFSAQAMIKLCRATYRRVPIFKTAIDLLTDLSNTKLHLVGGNAQSRDFFKGFWNRVNLDNVKAMFFKEIFLSNNVIYYRVDASLSPSDILKLNKSYAAVDKDSSIDIPTRYILMDAAQVCVMAIAFDMPCYYKILNRLELSEIKHSEDINDQLTYTGLKDAINAYSVGNGQALIKLDPSQIHTIFYQKQDYEPMAIPMGFCALNDINLVLEMRKADLAIARSVEYAILLITQGESLKDGGAGINPGSMNALKAMFKNENVSRVLVADYSTKAEFIIPDLTKILVPAKYDELNKTIASAMYNLFFGEMKYANAITKTTILTKKLENVQQLFLNEFVNKEIRRISKLMNFKSYPTAKMEPVCLIDQSNAQRVWAQLLQMGILTPKDGIELFDTGIYPEYETMEENQVEYKEGRDKGFWQPQMGGPFSQMQIAKQTGQNQMKLQQLKPSVTPPGGRPAGTKGPQTTKKPGTSGVSTSSVDNVEEVLANLKEPEIKFSHKLLVANTIKLQEVKSSLKDLYKKEKGIKKFTQNHQECLGGISKLLFENEKPEDWEVKAPEYIKDISKFAPNFEAIAEIEDIKNKFEVTDNEEAILLKNSKI